VQLLSGQELNNFYSGGGSRAATPKKRKLQGSSIVDNDDKSSTASETGLRDRDSIWDTDIMEAWAERGRKKRQKTSSETAPEDLPFPEVKALQ
jgi:hypothetical protein